jgi:two-component sensor histidine kinase
MAQVLELQDYRLSPTDQLRETHHRTANQLAVLAAMIEVQAVSLRRGADIIPKETALSLLVDTASRITGMARVHRRLINLPRGEDTDLSSLLIEGCLELANSMALGERVHFKHRLSSECRIGADQAAVLSLLVGEIVMNAIKYAHPTGIPVEISLSCATAQDGRPVIEIGDDGIGLPEGFDEARDGGAGFKIIRTLAENIGAELKVQSDDLGLSFRITLPRR